MSIKIAENIEKLRFVKIEIFKSEKISIVLFLGMHLFVFGAFLPNQFL